jgi:hypothetical protein
MYCLKTTRFCSNNKDTKKKALCEICFSLRKLMPFFPPFVYENQEISKTFAFFVKKCDLCCFKIKKFKQTNTYHYGTRQNRRTKRKYLA